MRIEASSGLVADLGGDGTIRIGWGEPDWFGPGVAVVDEATTWAVEASGDVLHLRLERAEAATGLASGTFAEPAVGYAFTPSDRQEGGAPDGMVAFGFQYTEFALPTRAGPGLDDWFLLDFRPPVVEPLLLIAPDLRTLLLAPVDQVHDQVVAPPVGGRLTLLAGWHGDLDEVPAGFATTLAVVPAADPRQALERWVELLRGDDPSPRLGPYADVLGRRLSYWTDNGAAYWYKTEPPRSVPETVVAAVDALREQGIAVEAVQLDSWWYPHQTLRPFDTDEWVVPPSGLLRWDPREDILPDGIPPLRRALGDPPLVTHTRHVSSQSPYLDEGDFWVDGDVAHPQDARYYERLLDQAQGWGVEVFEHDWLVECFLAVRGLRAAPGRARAWQEGLDRVAGERGMTLQWCMPSPADLMQAATLDHVTSIRTSGDHGYLVGPGLLWAWFCYVNVIARAQGLWPFKDVFRTDHGRTDESLMEALLSAMSGGPVGIGDRVGETDPAIVAPTCRRDGLLVKPDAPIAAIGRCFAQHVVMAGALMVAETHNDHPVGRYTYGLVFNPQDRQRVHADVVTPADLGTTAEHLVWDWRARAIVNPGEWDLELGPQGWEYRVHCPVAPSGLAVIGDADRFATAGQGRVRDVTVTPTGVSVRVLGPEETVTLTGAGPARAARAWTPARAWDLAIVDGADGTWTVDVDLGVLGWALVSIDA